MVAERKDKVPEILGEKAEYVLDATGMKGEVSAPPLCMHAPWSLRCSRGP
jgi:hypothetical protein